MAQQDIKQIRGASQGSILFLGTNSVVSEDSTNLSWDQSIKQLSITGNIKVVDGNQGAGKVLTGDASGNASWQPKTVSAAGGETGRTYYMSPSDSSDIPTYFVARTSPSGGTSVSIVQANTGTSSNLIGVFATPIGEPGVLELPSGIALRVVHGLVQSNPEIARYKLDLYKRSSGGTETLLRSGYSEPFGNTIKDEISFSFVAPDAFTLLVTDRIVFKLYTERVDGPSTVTVTTYFEGNDASYIKTTITDRFNLTSTYIPQSSLSGTSLIDGTWKYIGNDIVPVTASSNIGTTTSYVDKIYLGSTLQYVSNLIFSEGGTESARFNSGNFAIGTSSTSTNLVVEGGFRYVDGNQTTGYVLTSDSNGLSSWQAGNTVSSSNLQGNGLTANGSVLDVNVNSDSLEITNDLVRLKNIINGDRTFTNSVIIQGNLTVNGTASYVNSENLYVRDNIITLNATYSGVPVLDSGIEINRGTGTYSKLLWNETLDYWVAGLSGSESIIITEAGTGLIKTNNSLSVDYTTLPHTTSWSSAFNNGNVGSLTYLRRQDGTPTNISPYVVPVNMTIVMVAASSDVDQSWSMTIRKTDSVGLTYSTIHTITATASRQQINTGLSINLNAGDRIATRLEVGTSIDYPNLDIYVKTR